MFTHPTRKITFKHIIQGEVEMDNFDHILEISDLEKSYRTTSAGEGEKIYPVLRGISFDVRRQEFVGIMGRSGCGKTTLLKTLGLIHRQDAGSIFYKGVKTNEFYGDDLAELRRKEIAFIFQDFYLLESLSVRENIMLPMLLNEDDPAKGKRLALKLAEKFGLAHLLDKKPSELSGGEKQRTAICRAMIMNPNLILADEPTGNLDSNSSLTVIESLSQINREDGVTVLLVTHDPQIASYCSRIIFLKDGKILEELNREGTREEFYGRIVAQMRDL